MLTRSLIILLLAVYCRYDIMAQLTIPVDLKRAGVTSMPTGPYGFLLFDSLIYERGEGEYFLKYTQYNTSFVQE